MKTAGSGVGRPVSGSRACRCRIAAPASAASIAWRAMSSGRNGNASDMVGVWIAPVMAQLMITFCQVRFAISRLVLLIGGTGRTRWLRTRRWREKSMPKRTADMSPDPLRRLQHDDDRGENEIIR